jgi:polyisoprenyl-phosphate glycosyltransferase
MLSILIPAFNEEGAIQETITRIQETMDNRGIAYEIIVINDGSSDNTVQIVTDMGIQVISHPTNGGYGLALKTGLKHAHYDWCCIIDADGTYPVSSLPDLIQYIPAFDMVVGARTGSHYWGSRSKRLGRLALLKMISFVIGTSIPDANSGMRIFRASIARQHIQRISSGFSFTTTLTLAMFMEHHFVKYVPIEYYDRVGSSKVKIRIDSLRMLQILVMTTLYYNPLKLFLLVCMTTVSIGLIAGIWGVIGNNPFGIPLMIMSIFVSFIIGSLGFVAEALRLHRISNSIPTEVDTQLTVNE